LNPENLSQKALIARMSAGADLAEWTGAEGWIDHRSNPTGDDQQCQPKGEQ
jgi:hypothetical protein